MNCSWCTGISHSWGTHLQCTSLTARKEWIPSKHKWLARNNEIKTTTWTDKFTITLQTCTPCKSLQTINVLLYFTRRDVLTTILLWNLMLVSICDQACKNRPCEHKDHQFSCLLYHKFLYYHNKIFITTAEFNGLSSAVYRNGILHYKWKILA